MSMMIGLHIRYNDAGLVTLLVWRHFRISNIPSVAGGHADN
ncbi:MAG TPA: hypothetical protein ACQGQH_02285 [Xylella sp.]